MYNYHVIQRTSGHSESCVLANQTCEYVVTSDTEKKYTTHHSECAFCNGETKVELEYHEI